MRRQAAVAAAATIAPPSAEAIAEAAAQMTTPEAAAAATLNPDATPAQSAAAEQKADEAEDRLRGMPGRTGILKRFAETPPVQITGQEAPATGGVKAIIDWAVAHIRPEAKHPELGTVATDARAIKNSLSHGMSRAKVAAVAALPDLVERGIVAARTPQGEMNGVVLVAPLEIAGKPYHAFMLVREDANTKRLYVHEVVEMEKLQTPSRPGSVSQRTGATGATRQVAQQLFGVNPPAPGGIRPGLNPNNSASMTRRQTRRRWA